MGVLARVREALRPGEGGWGFMQGITAGGQEDPFLYQLRLVQTPWGGAYLHVILREGEAVPHDHPWRFASVVLWGWYQEAVYPDKRDPRRSVIRGRRRFSRGSIGLGAAHRITAAHAPVWTLVLTGPERNPGWGFYPGGRYVPWREYQGRKEARS